MKSIIRKIEFDCIRSVVVTELKRKNTAFFFKIKGNNSLQCGQIFVFLFLLVVKYIHPYTTVIDRELMLMDDRQTRHI